MEGCLIGLDLGSSAVKSVITTTDGGILFKTRLLLPPPFREGLQVEHSASDILSAVDGVLSAAVQAAMDAGLAPVGIGLSCQRSSCLVWDRDSGEALTPVLSWRDTRGMDMVEALSGEALKVHSTTGLPLTPYYAATKLRWLKENISATVRPSAVFGTLSAFIIRHLAPGSRPAIDHTNAARTQLMNIHTLAWDDDLIRLFGLSGVNLPEILPTASDFGIVSTAAGPVPILACIGDQQAAMIGQGVLEKGDAGINYGTGGFLMVNTGETLVLDKGLMASVHYSMNDRCMYLLEGSVNAVGDALEWVRLRLGLFGDYSEVDDMCWRSATDTVVFIGLNGTGAPHWETNISSAMHGLTAESGTADIVRGVVEGFAFFMKDIAAAVKAAGVEPRSFALSGGLSSLSYLTQIQCDLLGVNGMVVSEPEVSALGAALLAGMRRGVCSLYDMERITRIGEEIEGEKNPGAERRYKRWKELHRTAREMDRL